MIKEAKVLNQLIRNNQEYLRYQDAMKKVMEDTELYGKMNEFRKKNYELQNMDDGKNHYEELYALAIEYEKVLRHPMVNEFLMAEQIFSKRLSEVYEYIADGLELDYTYME